MALINDADKFLVNNGAQTQTVTLAQIKDKTMLNDNDLFLVNNGSKTETVKWSEMKDEMGPPLDTDVTTPTFTSPVDGAGDVISATSDVITDKNIEEGSTTYTSYCDNTAQSNMQVPFDSGKANAGDIGSKLQLTLQAVLGGPM